MSLTRRDLIKAFSSVPIVGFLGMAPADEKIIQKLDPEIHESITEGTKLAIAQDTGWMEGVIRRSHNSDEDFNIQVFGKEIPKVHGISAYAVENGWGNYVRMRIILKQGKALNV